MNHSFSERPQPLATLKGLLFKVNSFTQESPASGGNISQLGGFSKTPHNPARAPEAQTQFYWQNKLRTVLSLVFLFLFLCWRNCPWGMWTALEIKQSHVHSLMETQTFETKDQLLSKLLLITVWIFSFLFWIGWIRNLRKKIFCS